MQPGDPTDDDLPALPGVGEWLISVASGAPEAVLSGHPLVTLLGPLLAPLFRTVHALDERSWRQGALRGARALQIAAETSDIDVESLAAEIVRTDANTELAFRVLEAAARMVNLPGKIEALGRALGNGLDDDAKFEEAVLLVAALRECEKPHVRLLQKIENQPRPPHISPAPISGAVGWTQEQLVAESRSISR